MTKCQVPSGGFFDSHCILQGVQPLGGVKQWWGGENKLFCSYMSKYLKNYSRNVQSY